MLVLYTCPQGHQWEAADQDASASACPACGLSHTFASAGPGSTVPGADALPPRPASAVAPLPGYEILEELGRGGMGVVYKARHLSLNRIVALKMLLKGSDARPQEAARFRAEAEAVARLQHPHIVQVHDIGEHQDRVYLSLEYMAGGTLKARLSGQPWPPRDAATLIETLARAAHHAHGRNVVHRDLKPANVLLSGDELPKIADFGLAKLLDISGQTADGAVFGTPNYMAPEQAQGNSRQVGAAADVWALGAILYELLTGQPPFRGDTLASTIAKVLAVEPLPLARLNPETPARLEAICLRCLRKDPSRRYATAAALADDLHAFLETPQSTQARSPRTSGRAAWLAGAGVALTVLLLITVWIGWRLLPGSSTSRDDRSPIGPDPADPTGSAVGGPKGLGTAPVGAQWQTFSIGGQSGEVFDRIAFASRPVGYAASRDHVYKTTDGGEHWSPVYKMASGHPVHVLQFEDEQTGWLSSDRLYHTSDGGETWSPVPLPGDAVIRALSFAPNGAALAAGKAGDDLVLFRRATAAAAWDKLNPTEAGYWDAGGRSGRNYYPGEVAFLDDNVALLTLFSGSDDAGAVLRTVDSGRKWQAMGAAAGPEAYHIAAVDPSRAWVAGSSGQLWIANPAGALVEATNPTEEPIGRLAFDPHGSGFGVATIRKGNVLTTTDRAKAWALQTIPMLDCYSTPDAAVVDAGWAFVLTSDGRIARYGDPNAGK